jgi:hypothetical protein
MHFKAHVMHIGAATAALILIAISACPTSASGQTKPQSGAACIAAVDMTHQHLQGRWTAELQAAAPGAPSTQALLQLGPHPELAQSVRGTVQRDGKTALVSGDVDDGDLTLEESVNGTNISATWTGRVVDGSCGKEIRGTWNNASTPNTLQPFVLRKQATWQ